VPSAFEPVKVKAIQSLPFESMILSQTSKQSWNPFSTPAPCTEPFVVSLPQPILYSMPWLSTRSFPVSAGQAACRYGMALEDDLADAEVDVDCVLVRDVDVEDGAMLDADEVVMELLIVEGMVELLEVELREEVDWLVPVVLESRS